MRWIARTIAVVVLALIVSPLLVRAQSVFPNRTVKFVIPFPAGGMNDVLARIMADKLQAKWGHPIVIENKTGAGGNIGADLAAQAPPDGYTVFIAPPGPLAINQTLYKHLTYKPDDFVPITVVGTVPNLAIVRKDFPVNTLAELVAYVKQNPDKVVFGSQGNGATPHLTANLFMAMTGTKMVHVSYRGETLVYQDMLGGHVDLFFGNVAGALSLVRDGRLKALAVLDTKRVPQLPDVPTVAEAGMPDFISTAWFAAAGPPKLPPGLQADLAKALIDVLKMPDVQQKFRNISVEPGGQTPAETAAFIKDETKRWGKVIKTTGVVVD